MLPQRWTGLLFVAVSINLSRIMAIAHLPSRAAETLLVLVGVLVVSTCGLVPGQGRVLFGCEVCATGSFVLVATMRSQARAYAEARQWIVGRVLWTLAASLPFVIGGGVLAFGHDAGL